MVPGDELIAVDGYRLRRAADLPVLLQCHAVACITYVRRGRLAETRLNPDKGVDHWLLDWDPGANADQRALRDRWFRFSEAGLQSGWSAVRRHPLVLITAMSAGSLPCCFWDGCSPISRAIPMPVRADPCLNCWMKS